VGLKEILPDKYYKLGQHKQTWKDTEAFKMCIMINKLTNLQYDILVKVSEMKKAASVDIAKKK